MADPFIAEIIMFGGNFAPRGWALCDGQLLPINQNSALFSLLGTTYGGDGRVTFGLPDLRGRVSMHPGRGPGLSDRRLGEKGGVETVTLNATQIPSHTHGFAPRCAQNVGNNTNPTGNYPAIVANHDQFRDSNDQDMGAGTTAATGGSQAHANVQPYQCVNYIIALVGTFPSRN